MKSTDRSVGRSWRYAALPPFALALWFVAPLVALAAAPTAGEALLTRYAALRMQLEHGPYHRPLYIESQEGSGASQGDVFVVVDQPMTTVVGALGSPGSWCDLLLLHLNVKYCHPESRSGQTVLRVAIGKKFDQPLEEAYRIDLDFRVTASGPEFLDVELNAPEGPFATHDYHIAVQVVPISGGQSFLHLRYSFAYGWEGGLAMSAYLATAGREKVGFTMISDAERHSTHLIGGIRGAVERNAMRYYLAVEAYLASLASPQPARFARSLELWFDATEAYPTQLHEVDRDTYLAMKRHEHDRQQSLQ